MNRFLLIVVGLPMLALAIASCGGQSDEPDQAVVADTTGDILFTADRLLPESTSTAIRLGDPETILRARAHQFLGSSVSLYQNYRLVGLVSTKYMVDSTVVFTEIAQCAGNIEAYGLYAAMRPAGIDTYQLGTEGYLYGKSLYFTQADYVITLSTFDETEKGSDAMRLLAVTISARIGTVRGMPEQFTIFPDDKRIEPSARYYPSGFLDIPGLSRVFTASYLLDDDTLVLFLTEDKGGTKFVGVIAYVAEDGEQLSSAPEISFDEGYGLVFAHPGRGTVLAGLKHLKLVGAVGYDGAHAEAFVRNWIDSLE